jgi:hypothetical protein
VNVEGERIEVVQPIELPHEWDAEQFLTGRQAPQGGAPLARARALPGDGSAIYDLRESRLESPSVDSLMSLSLGAGVERPSSRDVPGGAGRGRGAEVAQDGGPARDARAEQASRIARMQRADGSLGGDVVVTTAGLAALVMLGHTSRRGDRRRTVEKAAAFLRRHSDHADVALVLELLERAESGDRVDELLASYWSRLVALPAFAEWQDVVWPEHP